jgi:hypothetical protein
MGDRLRRLGMEEPRAGWRRFGGDERFRMNQVHPFRFIHEPRTGHKMRVCLDSAALGDGSSESQTALRLLADLRPEHYELFRTPGDADASLADVPAFIVGEAADVASVSLVAFGHERGTGVHYPGQWDDLAEQWVRDRSAGAQLVAVKAAEALGAHVFITASPALLRVREVHRFKTAVVTPLEALPILWSWCRGFGDFWDGNVVTSAQAYYWELARALTPNGGPGFAALVYGEYRRPDGHELVALAQSVLTRLASSIHGLDDMYRAWQLPTDNDTIDTLCDSFDQIVLGVSAILDNLALLAGKYFGVSGLKPREWSLVNARYLRALRTLADPKAGELADYVDSRRPRLTFHAELRHHAVHREKLAGILYRREREPEEMRLRIFEPVLGKMCDQLEAAGEDPSQWGITHREGPHDTPVSFVGQPDRVETLHSPGEALLDPMSFAPRLVWLTAQTIDEVFGKLRLQDDPSLTQQDRDAIQAVESGTPSPVRPSDRETLVLTSPMSGLG